ncbi:MAG: hypothetical protein P8X64_16100 [Anaerolineales bacterium]
MPSLRIHGLAKTGPLTEVNIKHPMGVQIDQDLTDKMVERAIAACANTHFAGDEHRVRQALIRGQCEHCICVTDALVGEISAYLGEVAGSIKSIHRCEVLDKEQALIPGHSGIHLVAWVERKSAALRALTDTLEKFLAESKRKLGCPKASPDCFTLDVEMVDDHDVQEGRGFGLLIPNEYMRSTEIWTPGLAAREGTPPRL